MPLFKSASNAHRPKTGAKSIRGTISGPIPIPNPLDDEFPIRNPGSAVASTTKPTTADDEFPIRRPGTNIASPVPPEEPDDSLATPTSHVSAQHQAPSQPPPPPPSQPPSQPPPQLQPQPPPQLQPQVTPPRDLLAESASSNGVPLDPPPSFAPVPGPPAALASAADSLLNYTPPRASPEHATPPRHSITRKATPTRSSVPHARQVSAQVPPPAAARYSMVSETPTSQTGQSQEGPRRKKSTLRSALGRLFGRRKKTVFSQDMSSVSEHISGPAQHRSDPSALRRPKEPEPESTRSASLPVTDFNMALRSNSVGPTDLMAIDNVRNSLQVDVTGPTHVRERANTATGHGGRQFIQPRRGPAWGMAGQGLTPRPASIHGRDGRASRLGENDPEEIGRAITSDSANNGPKRRSRSLSNLEELLGRSVAQRRSDELRFWRESYDQGLVSPISSSHLENEEFSPSAVAEEFPPKTPPQPFNFSPITSEMAGMKITQAASLNTRMGNVECRVLKVERVVDRLYREISGSNGRPTGGSSRSGERRQSGPTAPKPTPPALPASRYSSSRYSSSRRSNDTDARSQVSLVDAPAIPVASQAVLRPNSTAIVRAAISMPAMNGRSSSSESSSEQIGALQAQLDAERAARQALEDQVKKLSERVNALSATMFAMVNGGPAKNRSQEHLRVANRHPPPPHPLKLLSVFQSEDDDRKDDDDDDDDNLEEAEEEGRAGFVRPAREEEEVTEDEFRTPREESPPHPYGAFGEKLHDDEVDDDEDDEVDVSDDDPKRKKAARTLSLSQLTMSRQQQGVQGRI